MSLTVITAPEYVGLNPRKISLFFGGSIELGASRDWQAELVNILKDKSYGQYLEVLNPRRAAWDSSWPIDDPTHPELKDQINWELYYQDKVDILIYNFATGTVAPITLLELGTYAPRNPVINIEGGYKRHANVKITADHFGWEYCEDWDSFIKAIDQRVQLQLDFRHNIIMK